MVITKKDGKEKEARVNAEELRARKGLHLSSIGPASSDYSWAIYLLP